MGKKEKRIKEYTPKKQACQGAEGLLRFASYFNRVLCSWLCCVVCVVEVASKRRWHKSEALKFFVVRTCNVRMTSQNVRRRTLCCSLHARVSARCH